MTRDWKTRESMENPHYCWEDPIFKDEFGITEKDWKDTIQQTVKHIRDQMDPTLKARISCILDLLLPPLQALWQGKTETSVENSLIVSDAAYDK